MARNKATRVAQWLFASTALCASAANAQTTSVEELVVTASGYEQKITQAPASISVVTRAQLEQKPFTSLEDAVRNLEGVSVVGGDPNSTDIVIRGMPGEYTLIMLDGRRQTTRETMNRGTGGVQANLIPPAAAIERIEVVRGPMSSLYGSDAMGGVVNVITRKVPKEVAGSLTLGGIVQEDSAFGNTTIANFWFGAPLKDETIGLQIYGGLNDRAEDDIFFPTSYTAGANRVQDRNINGKLSFVLQPGHDLTLSLGRNLLRYTDTPGKSADPTTTIYDENHRRTYLSAAYEGQWDFGTTKLSVYQEDEKLSVSQGGVMLNQPHLTNTTVDALIAAPIGRHSLSAGAQYIYTEVTGIGAQDNVSGYVNINEATRESWALFAEDQFSLLDNLTITAGGRVDHYDQFGSHFTPRVYANYTLAPGWTLRGGVAGGFKAPTLRQSTEGYCMTTGGGSLPRGPLCGNPDLEPETSTTAEVGLRYDGEGKLGLGATLYHTKFRNKVVSFDSGLDDPINPTRPLYVYDNVDRVMIQGVELTATAPINDTLLINANYTYTDSERRGGGEPAFDGSSLDGLPLDKTPEHVFNAKLTWDPTDKFSAYASAYYTGKQYYTGFRNGAVKTRTRGDSTTFDLGASYAVTDNFAIKAAILNVFDKIVPVDDRGRFNGLDGNWMVDEGRRLWATAVVSF